MQIFFSHKSEDKPLIREIKNHFPTWLKIWLDEDELLFGEDISKSLKNAINHESDYLIVFLNESSIRSKWVQSEIEWAIEKETDLGRTFVLPVLIGNVRDKLNEIGLKGRKTIDLPDNSKEGSKLVAMNIVNHIGGWLTNRIEEKELNGSSLADEIDELQESFKKLLHSIVKHFKSTPSEWQEQVETLLVRPFLRKANKVRYL